MDKLTATQTIIITLDVDAYMFDNLHHIAEAGFYLVEINSADTQFLKNVIQTFPKLRIGAGNIINTEQLENCYQAGVSFVTSPGFLPSIAQTANVYSMNYLPGIATLSEAMQAMAVGCQHVRPFPATLQFCTLLNKYMPQLSLFPAEIESDEVDHFLNLPSVAAVSILNPNIRQLQLLNMTVL